MQDFVRRVEQLRGLQGVDASLSRIWFGGLFFPEAYLTATKQIVAEKNSWSLGKLLKKDIDLQFCLLF